MWYLASYNRPDAIRALSSAPGGWPSSVVVLINEDDPELSQYQADADNGAWPSGWQMVKCPPGRLADVLRWIYPSFKDDAFYGFLADDFWPETPSWWTALEESASNSRISYAWGQFDWPRIRSAVCFGGDLIRAMGSIVPQGFKHNYVDDAWERIGRDFGILMPREDIRVIHKHWIADGDIAKDETYLRGSRDAKEDEKAFYDWLGSNDRKELNDRVADFLRMTYVEYDFSKVLLGIIYSTRDATDVVFNRSMAATLGMLRQHKIRHGVIESTGGSHVGKAREAGLWRAMNHFLPFTHLLWIDDDMGWEPRDVMSMLAADKDFLAGVGVKKTEKQEFCLNLIPGPLHVEDGLIEIKEVGFAFVMLKRCVIDILCAAYPNLEYKTKDGSRQFALFFDLLDYTNPGDTLPDRLGEDYSFCRRWRKIGGKVWADPTIELVHVGRKEYRGRLSDAIKFQDPVAQAAE